MTSSDHNVRQFLFPLLIAVLFLFIWGCNNASEMDTENTDPHTGSVSFQVNWGIPDDDEGVTIQEISDVCGPDWYQVNMVNAAVYDGDTQVAVSSDWPCSNGSGTLYGVRPGNFRLIVIGTNSDGNTRYCGETQIDVNVGQTTNAGTILTNRFYAYKTDPPFSGAMGIDPYNHTFEWYPAIGALEYHIIILDLPWDDPSATRLVDEFVTETSYTITVADGLNPDTNYYWGVFPVDFEQNGSYDDVWRFYTGTAVSDDSYEENDTLATAWDNNGDPAGWEATWLSNTSDSEENGTAVLGDDDWYKIEVNSSGYERVMVECRFDHDIADIELYLYDYEGTLYAYAESGDDNEFIDFVVPSIGTYYLQVQIFDGGSNTYNLYWNDVPESGVEGIWTLDFDWDCDGSIGEATLVLYSNERFVTHSADGTSHGSWFLSGDQIILSYGSGTIYSGTLETSKYEIMDGTMVSFDGSSGCWSAYRWTGGESIWDDNYEENDTLATAYDLSSDEATDLYDIDGPGVAKAWDEDWYKIEITPGYEQLDIVCTFSLPYFDEDIDMELYTATGTFVTGSYGDTDNETISIDLTGWGAGTYYINVYYEYEEGFNTYDLWWDDTAP